MVVKAFNFRSRDVGLNASTARSNVGFLGKIIYSKFFTSPGHETGQRHVQLNGQSY